MRRGRPYSHVEPRKSPGLTRDGTRHHAMSSAVQAVELACSIAGTTAFRATSPLERCFRDVQTMRHHVFASEARYGTFGQVYLGVPPDFPVVAF